MYKILNKKQDSKELEIMIYSLIDPMNIEGFTISAKKVIDTIKNNADIEKITLRINSDGGDVFEAFAMYNYLKQHKAKKHVYIDGIAASAASLVAMSGDVVYMPENAMMMIHNPSSYVYGNADDMRDSAEVLDKITDNIVKIYVDKTGLTESEVKDMLNQESYLSAKECKEKGFCDEIISGVKNQADGELDAIINEATMIERKRIKDLDELMTPARAEIINRAKFETGESAKDIALELLKAESTAAKEIVQIEAKRADTEKLSRELDSVDTMGVNFQDVKPVDNQEAIIMDMAKKINTQRGYK